MTKRTRQALVLLSAVLLAAASAGCSTKEPAPARLGNSRAPAPSTGSGSHSARADGAAKGFTLVATGDVLPHDSVIKRAAADAEGDGHDFKPMFSLVKPVVSAADLAICHMETVYGEDGGPFTGYPAFSPRPKWQTG